MTESERERHWRQLYAAELEVSDKLRAQLRVAEEVRDAARAASTAELERRREAKIDLIDLVFNVRAMLEVHDRPCEPNGDWKHTGEYWALNEKVRALVGLQPNSPEWYTK